MGRLSNLVNLIPGSIRTAVSNSYNQAKSQLHYKASTAIFGKTESLVKRFTGNEGLSSRVASEAVKRFQQGFHKAEGIAEGYWDKKVNPGVVIVSKVKSKEGTDFKEVIRTPVNLHSDTAHLGQNKVSLPKATAVNSGRGRLGGIQRQQEATS